MQQAATAEQGAHVEQTGLIQLAQLEAEVKEEAIYLKAEKIVEMMEKAEIPDVQSDEQEQTVTEMFLQCGDLIKQVEKRRKERVDPYNKSLGVINGTFKALMGRLEKIKDACDGKLKVWRRFKREQEAKLQAQIAREQARLEKQFEKKGIDAPPPKLEAPKFERTTRTASGSAYERKKLEVEVVDLQALCKAIGQGKVPVGCVSPIKSALTKHAELNPGQQIPGCKIYEDSSLVGRTS